MNPHLLFSNVLADRSPSFRMEESTSPKSVGETRLAWLGRDHQLTCSATSALYLVAQALGIDRGNEVLVPAYHCGKELPPFKHLGARPVFYRIDVNLAPQIEHIEALINSRTKAILVTHFFGFPTPMDALKSLCRAKGIRLIEDCSHAYLGHGPAGPIGASGDAAVFSPRKFLPIPDGGIAVINAPDVRFLESAKQPIEFLSTSHSFCLWHKSLKLNAPLTRRIPQRLIFTMTWPLKLCGSMFVRSVAKATRQWDADIRKFNPPGQVLSQGMSLRSQNYIEELTDQSAIVRARRRNYKHLLNATRFAESLEPLFNSLPSGVNPLFFPAKCRHPKKAVKAFTSRGIWASPWWKQAHSEPNRHSFPIEHDLESTVIVLPVHQSLTQEAVLHIANIIEDLRL